MRAPAWRRPPEARRGAAPLRNTPLRLAAGLTAALITAGCATTRQSQHEQPDHRPTRSASVYRTAAPPAADAHAEQDALAEQPMPSLPVSASVPHPLSTR